MNKKVFVLMYNDGVVGVTRDEKKAQRLCIEARQRGNKRTSGFPGYYHYDEAEDLDDDGESK